MKKRILFLLLLLLTFGVNVVLAYFTDQKEEILATFKTAELKIQVIKDDISENPALLPGSEKEIYWSTKNIGTVPVHLRSKLTVDFTNSQLSDEMVEIVSVERKLSDESWQELKVENNQFFVSRDGTADNLINIDPDSLEKFRAKIKLLTEISNEYQLSEFNFSINVAAKQVDSLATWPI